MSHISILTGGSDIYEPFVSKVKDKVGLSEVRLISASTTKQELSNLSCDEPFFSDKFVVEVVTERIDKKELKELLYNLRKWKNSMFIFIHNNRDSHDICMEIFSSNDIKELNCYKPPFSIFELYVSCYTRKKYTVKALDLMYKNMGGQWSSLGTYVNILEDYPASIITDGIISETVPKAVRLNINSFLVSLMTLSNLQYNIKVLFNYKYANKYIMNSLEDKILDVIKYKKDYVKGILSESTMHEYAKENKVSLGTLSEYYDKILTKYDIEYLYYYKALIKKFSKHNDGFLMLILEVLK